MLSCLQACAGSAGAAGVDSAATKKPVQVRWPQDKLKTGKNGELLLRVYVVEDQQVEERELENYVKGVLAGEMKNDWPLEALKAQAIAARSYALANLGKRASSGYDLKDTPEDQAYGGASAETVKTNEAVDSTTGLVLTYNTKVVPAYYSASAGGKTINASAVWGNDLPFIRSVPSYDDNVKKNGHGVGMSQHGANNLAKQGYNAYQILSYFFQNVKFAKVNENSLN